MSHYPLVRDPLVTGVTGMFPEHAPARQDPQHERLPHEYPRLLEARVCSNPGHLLLESTRLTTMGRHTYATFFFGHFPRFSHGFLKIELSLS